MFILLSFTLIENVNIFGISGWMSSFVGHINPVAQQKRIKKEEPEDEGYVCTSVCGKETQTLALYSEKKKI